MRRKLLFGALAGAIALAAGAQDTSTYDFTYADPAASLGALGDRTPMSYDVAILIDNPALKGWTVKSIAAYTNAWEDVSNTSVWVSDRLTVSGGSFKPGITSQEVTPRQGAYGGDSELGLFEATLDNPYTMTGEPVYVGYSLKVDNAKGTGQQYPVLYTKNFNANGLFYRSSQGITAWTDYSATGCAAITVTFERNNAEYSIGICGVNAAVAAVDKPYNVTMSLSNVGIKDIEEISYTYSCDGASAPVAGLVTLPSPIRPDALSFSQVTFPMEPLEETGKHTVAITIDKVNGQPNFNLSASKEVEVTVYPYLPQHRPLIEEYTSLGCGWCPRGWLAMEMIDEEYGDSQVTVCYHNSSMFGPDPMTVTNVYPVEITGLPAASIDRNGTLDPYYGATSDVEFGISASIDESMASLAIAEITGTATLEGETVKVSTQTSFITDVANANYQIGYVLTASGLMDPTWAQSNYFALPQYKNQFLGTPLEVLTTWKNPMRGLEFNFVAVNVDGINGVKESLPGNIVSGETYTYDFTIDIAGNPLIQHKDNMAVVFYVVNRYNGRIVNANQYKFTADDGVESIVGNDEVVHTEYHDLTGRRIASPAHGIFLRTDRMSGGKTTTSKVLVP